MHPHVHAETQPDAPALILSATEETITYGALEERANRLAHAFRKLGLANGDAISVVCDNRPEYLDVYWAAQRSGLVIVPVSTWLKPTEIAFIVRDSSSKALLVAAVLEETWNGLNAIRAEMPDVTYLLSIDPIDGAADVLALAAGQPSTRIPDEWIGGCMAYSSGTTGLPKGVRHRLAGGSPVQPTASSSFAQFYGMDHDTVYLYPAPLYHAAPLGMSAGVQSLGGTVVLMRKFDPEQLLAAIERWRVTVFQAVPTMFIRLLALPEEVRNRYDLSSIKTVIHAAAPCPVPVKHAMLDWLGPIVEEYYAGSEGNGIVTISSEEWLKKPGSVGRPLRGEIHICDDQGRELPSHENGIIYFSGGQSFMYHNDPSKTESSRNPIHPEWSTLGDVGRIDEDGYLFLSDRKDFMIISGGVNIYPQDIENLLIMHPDVADVAVFGVPNPDLGEEVKAVVQPRDWSRASPGLASELIDWCRNKIADVKCPRSIEFEQALPRTETGKLFKKDLKARYWPSD